ncbi:unnamed protein product (macronuclear) [Paramecium tetraurelia]|uniref:Transmembrane protein n=1 Tax=Paramecium tetraurelia TaxID=5888 RepID=A0EBU8_PARTE|nr:uncharacterized protein GSPATT00025500001 [Paramecium tetraurelia]CAK92765.1 unnamed protein product [Paramecium tetraurelia]|eukprot:XP_001460162.1 hypothetical protein (macronuclear) [Paramecium tetraurelia strain d4-2]
MKEAPKGLALNATSLSRYVSQFLSTSKGRDKFMALLQYSFDFYHSCTKHSNLLYVQQLVSQNDLKCYVVAEKFKDVISITLFQSISQSRKIFRLLFFLDEIKGIQRLIKQNKPLLFKILAISGHYSSFMYYVSDNFLWIIAILAQSKVLQKEIEARWKQRKNSFSQMRIMINLLRLTILIIFRENKENRILLEMTKIMTQDTSKKLQNSLIKLRRKRRFEILELILSILRFFMLTKSLRMTGYQYLDPVFVACIIISNIKIACGLVSSGLALFKAIYEKRIFIQLDNSSKIESQINSKLTKGFASSGKMDDSIM